VITSRGIGGKYCILVGKPDRRRSLVRSRRRREDDIKMFRERSGVKIQNGSCSSEECPLARSCVHNNRIESWCSELWHRIVMWDTNVSENHIASIFRMSRLRWQRHESSSPGNGSSDSANGCVCVWGGGFLTYGGVEVQLHAFLTSTLDTV
jgi:hypothetical protein